MGQRTPAPLALIAMPTAAMSSATQLHVRSVRCARCGRSTGLGALGARKWLPSLACGRIHLVPTANSPSVRGMQASTSCLSPQHRDSVESGKRAREGVLADLPLSFAAKLRRTRDLRLRDEATWPRAAAAAPARCAGTADCPVRLTAAPGAAPYLSSCSGTGGGSADHAAVLAANAPAASWAAERARLSPERRAVPASPEHGCGPFITGARVPPLPMQP